MTNLLATVRHWNEMIDRGSDTEFHRFEISSADPPARINTPPFYAVQFFPLARKSLGGVAVDLGCRVLDNRGQPIPGLYAVGELAGVGGINGRAALEGTMLGPSILMGRVAASDVTKNIPRRLEPPQPHAQSMIPPKSQATELDNLRAWQEVLRQLIAQPRPGYLHFEKAHTIVVARNYDCAQCHREISPLALMEDQLDRRAIIQACPACHGGVKE